jgi:hypothetical protein
MTTETMSVARTVRPVPWWARWAATGAAWSVVPSGLWRIALGLGFSMGFSGASRASMESHMPGWGTAYVIGLSALAEAFAFLAIGLVRPWGEVVPRWIPVLGGRAVRPWAAIVPATLGAAVLTLATSYGASQWYGPDNNGAADSPHGAAGLLMTVCYAPLLAWGPLLAVATYAYYRRTRP